MLVNCKRQVQRQKAYCLGELGNGEYDQGLIAFFEQNFDGEVIKDSFPTNTSDFTTYLNKAVAEDVDVIFCQCPSLFHADCGSGRLHGPGYPLLGSDTLDSNMVLEAAQGSNVQLYVSTFYQEGGSPKFDDGIKAWLNEDSTAMTNNGSNDTIAAVTAMGYDAYYVALEALKAAGSTDPAAVSRSARRHLHRRVSSIAFDDQGDAIRDTAYIKTADTANNVWKLETVRPWNKPAILASLAGVTPPGGCLMLGGRAGPPRKGPLPGPFETVLSPVIFERKGIPVEYGISILLSGISLGGQYALIAIGYTMVYGILRLINFAHGDVFMAGLIMVYLRRQPAHRRGAAADDPADGAAGLCHRAGGLQKPLRSAPRMSVMISAIGVSYLLQDLATYITGGLPQMYPSLPVLSSQITIAMPPPRW